MAHAQGESCGDPRKAQPLPVLPEVLGTLLSLLEQLTPWVANALLSEGENLGGGGSPTLCARCLLPAPSM